MGDLAEQLEQMTKIIFPHIYEGACCSFGLSALPHKGPAGISAASGCWDNSSGQQHVFKLCLDLGPAMH